MNTTRRTILKSMLAWGGLAAAAAGGLLKPLVAMAQWPKTAFESRSVDDALKALLGDAEAVSSDRITLKAPDIAENGAVVPIGVSTDIENVESISILVAKNPSPLAASFDITADAMADVSTRIKMGETSDVIALVKAGGKAYTVSKEVKVTIGGCGG